MTAGCLQFPIHVISQDNVRAYHTQSGDVGVFAYKYFAVSTVSEMLAATGYNVRTRLSHRWRYWRWFYA